MEHGGGVLARCTCSARRTSARNAVCRLMLKRSRIRSSSSSACSDPTSRCRWRTKPDKLWASACPAATALAASARPAKSDGAAVAAAPTPPPRFSSLSFSRSSSIHRFARQLRVVRAHCSCNLGSLWCRRTARCRAGLARRGPHG